MKESSCSDGKLLFFVNTWSCFNSIHSSSWVVWFWLDPNIYADPTYLYSPCASWEYTIESVKAKRYPQRRFQGLWKNGTNLTDFWLVSLRMPCLSSKGCPESSRFVTIQINVVTIILGRIFYSHGTSDFRHMYNFCDFNISPGQQ